MNEQISKYRINEYLYNLNAWQYRKIVQLLPKLLGVSLNTFHNYRRILVDDVQDVPYEKVVIIEQLFDFAPGTLASRNPEARSLKELLH
ncbi:hypothetical protein HQN84_05190 [Pedobacter steynii]|nr:hypothetical protein [Pedobacter steynii]NQX38229.1 hypothetical protein [Pedobacter steynii]